MTKSNTCFTACLLSIIANAILGYFAWQCYGEKSPEEVSSITEMGLTCSYNRDRMRLYEKKGNGFGIESIGVVFNERAETDFVLIYTFPLGSKLGDNATCRRKRVVCVCGNQLFFSYVIDDSGLCTSILLQKRDLPMFYFPSDGESVVEFPNVDISTLQNQKKLLRIVDE